MPLLDNLLTHATDPLLAAFAWQSGSVYSATTRTLSGLFAFQLHITTLASQLPVVHTLRLGPVTLRSQSFLGSMTSAPSQELKNRKYKSRRKTPSSWDFRTIVSFPLLLSEIQELIRQLGHDDGPGFSFSIFQFNSEKPVHRVYYYTTLPHPHRCFRRGRWVGTHRPV